VLETLIIGLIVAVASGLILHHIFDVGKNKQDNVRHDSGSTAVSQNTTGANTPISSVKKHLDYSKKTKSRSSVSLSPSGIMYEISKRPPAQGKDFMRKFEGMEIEWNTTFVDVSESNNLYSVSMLYRQSYPWIYATFPKRGNEQLHLIHESHSIRVKGVIKKVEQTQIWLSSVELSLK